MVKVNPISNYPVSEGSFVLRDLLKRVLATTEKIYEYNGVPLPPRRYWCLGQAAEDCEQVVVVLTNARLGSPGDPVSEPVPCSSPRYVTVEVRVSRHIPQGANGEAARPERLQEASEWPAVDMWLLLDNLADYDVTTYGTRGSGVLADVASAAPGGFIQTTTLTLTLGVI